MSVCVTVGCGHYAGYQTWSDDYQGELPICACCYGEPVDPHECDGQPPKERV